MTRIDSLPAQLASPTDLIEALPVPIIGVDRESLVTIWNAAAEGVFGWTAHEVVGRPLPTIPPDADAEHRQMLEAVLRGERIANREVVRVGCDGRLVPILLSTAHVLNADGEIAGAIGIYQDLTDIRRAEQLLGDRDAALRLVIDELPAVVWTVDHTLTMTSTRGRGQTPMRDLAMSFVGRTLLDALPEESGTVLAARAALGGESSRYTLDIEDHTFDVAVGPLSNGRGGFSGAIGIAFDVTERRRAEDALRASREELRRLGAYMTAVEESQRRRIARELHDELGQRLTALRFEVDLVRKQIASGLDVEERLQDMEAMIVETANTIRRVVAELRPPLLDEFGLSAAIDHELSTMRRRTGIAYDLAVPPSGPALDRDRTTALFRIVQESLTNVVRHSGATHVEVSLTEGDAGVLLEIRDNGRGIRPEEVQSATSFGIVGLRERAWTFGGEVSIGAGSGGGTRVAVRLPAA